MTFDTALKLGRVSNLPTVWSNVLAALVIAGGVPSIATVVLLGLSASLLYVGGMYLNDAFDAELDAKERPERPIPAGEVSKGTVQTLGFGMLAAGVAGVGVHAVTFGTGTYAAVLAAAATVALIVIYDLWHKGNPIGPAIMGLCRVGVYALSALSVAPSLSEPVLWGGGLLLLYVLGLTYVAKHENSGTLGRAWPRACLYLPILYSLPLLRSTLVVRLLVAGFGMWVGRSIDFAKKGTPAGTRTAVVSLIAGISLLDAMLIARTGHIDLIFPAIGAFGLTLVLQRRVAGT